MLPSQAVNEVRDSNVMKWGWKPKDDVCNPIFCSLLTDAPQLSHASFTFQMFLSCPRQVPSPFQLPPHLRTSRSTCLPSPGSSGLPSTHMGNNKPRPFGHRLLGPIPSQTAASFLLSSARLHSPSLSSTPSPGIHKARPLPIQKVPDLSKSLCLDLDLTIDRSLGPTLQGDPAALSTFFWPRSLSLYRSTSPFRWPLSPGPSNVLV